MAKASVGLIGDHPPYKLFALSISACPGVPAAPLENRHQGSF